MKNIEDRLMKEYELLVNLINRIGSTIIIVKGWTITLVIGVLFLNNSKFDLPGLLITIGFIFIFWVIEGYYRSRTFQFKKRMDKIEDCFGKNNQNTIKSPLIKKSIKKDYILGEFFKYYTFLLYLLLIIVVIVFYCYSNFKI